MFNQNDSPVPTLKRRLDAINTPDLLQLTKKPYYVLLVYDNLQDGGTIHHFLQGCPYLGVCTTLTDKYRMDLVGDLPVVFDEKRRMVQGRIRGEAYLVTLPTLINIDNELDNTGVMQRRSLLATLDEQSGKVNGLLTKVFMYLGVEYMWEDKEKVTQTGFVEGHTQFIYEW